MTRVVLAWCVLQLPSGALPVGPRLAGIASIVDSIPRRAALDPLVTEVVTRARTTERRLVRRLGGSILADSARRAASDDSAARADLQRVLRATAAEGAWGARRIRSVVAVFGSSPIVATQMAAVYRAEGQPDSAVTLYRRLVAMRPENAEWHRGLADALLAAGRRVEALDRLVIALDLDPADAWAFRELLRHRQDEASLERLLLQIRRHQVRHPSNAIHVEREVEVLQRLGRPDEAAALRRPPTEERPG